ncbi:hypothetical protein KBY96_14725 [Cyanobium sp. ATX 6A2]|uniref:hypothetical protein n=1 Tax=Cyanobium sp. ATX 6A2 TaxID=2823700 RepID=UPI0020CD4D56|nr:hypothetical protein [Cyanobium sp. ATX 6A2]MCP9889173.1 hypothetical protein [Cyanobium sp. ATX 6A2]
MTRRDSLVTAAMLLICAGILVLFTDVETKALRWLNCGPLASPAQRASEICR